MLLNIYKKLYLFTIYIYIYIERERERELENWWETYINILKVTYPLVVGKVINVFLKSVSSFVIVRHSEEQYFYPRDESLIFKKQGIGKERSHALQKTPKSLCSNSLKLYC